jgi:hypothetical protein
MSEKPKDFTFRKLDREDLDLLRLALHAKLTSLSGAIFNRPSPDADTMARKRQWDKVGAMLKAVESEQGKR